MGQCPGCREWNTLTEELVNQKTPVKSAGAASVREALQPMKLSQIALGQEERVSTGYEELDRVLGGGIVPGSLVLVGGDPGIGKSTLLLQVCRNLSAELDLLYISGEESLKQIKLRAERIGSFSDRLSLLCETNLDLIAGVLERQKPQVVVIDSIQTMYREDVSSAPGSVSQVQIGRAHV